ncbi:hypothetical protein BC939DRAFT_444108 [Gamsiella multidivaricata]|uniref:uncharacterized protein n=1 Tax=Gamsiella multidivaricata TaxID=101098 RepID=UPI0022207B49|nr:uncharacterized protein BC939DRAFT_444108 [Gamsiella multidivaricata]KAI7827940.1 hypothetical protein BC939DRAFT_444108 [Gamsiella multidivaricata]
MHPHSGTYFCRDFLFLLGAIYLFVNVCVRLALIAHAYVFLLTRLLSLSTLAHSTRACTTFFLCDPLVAKVVPITDKTATARLERAREQAKPPWKDRGLRKHVIVYMPYTSSLHYSSRDNRTTAAVPVLLPSLTQFAGCF